MQSCGTDPWLCFYESLPAVPQHPPVREALPPAGGPHTRPHAGGIRHAAGERHRAGPDEVYKKGGIYKDIIDASARSLNIEKIAKTLN